MNCSGLSPILRFFLALLAILALSVSPAFAAKVPHFLVVLDAGHGGDDTGAIHKVNGRLIKEKDLTLSIAKKTSQALRRLGISAILTRYEDRHLSLDERTEIANNVKASVFVSIHVNSSEDAKSTGMETYVFNATTNEAARRLADLENGKSNRVYKAGGPDFVELIMDDLATTANYASSMKLAHAIQEKAAVAAKSRSRGTRQALFYVLMKTQMPGVLFEPGFLSNTTELRRLRDPGYQSRLAQGLAQGILKWKNALPRSIINRPASNTFAAERD